MEVFGYLTVIQEKPCSVRCICGKEYRIKRAKLLSGNSRSCGCKKGERISQSKTTHGAAKRGAKSVEWKLWTDMLRRCSDPDKYPYHAGKGIQVCERWRNDFTAFLADVGPRPSPELSIDRIDSNKNYEPGNVRWATDAEQSQNRSNVRWYTYNGITLCMAGWARLIGVGKKTIRGRIDRGWPIEIALSAAPNSQPRRARP
jgi:hypothetical protein